MQTSLCPALPAVLDLDAIEMAQRARVWSESTPQLFPGLTIERLANQPALGTLKHVALGAGSLWYIRAPPALVHYEPPARGESSPVSFSLVLQVSDRLMASQCGRECVIGPDELCFIDERFAFRQEGARSCELILLRMPRSAVLASHPHLVHATARVLGAQAPGTMLLRDTLLGILRAADLLGPQQRTAALASIIQMLGIAEVGSNSGSGPEGNWRIRTALSYIELGLADPALTPREVAGAQGISRRRLDELFLMGIGVTIAAHIWNRRLAQTAAWLSDPRRAHETVAQIAHAAGFTDASHFARAFKRRFGCSAGRWRERTSGQLPGGAPANLTAATA